MANKMLIDAAHPEETRVVVCRGNRVEEFDFESAARQQLRGNIYLAKVTRVEPSLQAAFVEYGGNRHGFLAFSEIHPDYYQIPVSDRQALLEEQRAEAERRAESDDGVDDPTEEATTDYPDVSDDLDASDDGDDVNDADPNDEIESIEHEDVLALDDEAESAESAEADSEAAEDNADAAESSAFQEETATDGSDGTDDCSADASTAETADVLATGADDAAPSEVEASPEETATSEKDEISAAEASDEDEGADPAPTSYASTQEGLEAPEIDAPIDADEIISAETENTETENNGQAETATVGDDDTVPEVAEPEEADQSDQEASGDNIPSENESRARDSNGARSRDGNRGRRSRRSRGRRPYKIQEVIKRRQILLIQVVKEERGNKGAALTTYLSLAGRYCVLMPNTARGGGISRKISNVRDRKKLKQIAAELDIPEGMGLIIRTAGANRTKAEIRRDFDYLLRLWENVRELTLSSSAPTLVYEEGSLIKRSIRDLYNKEIESVQVEGEGGYKEAKSFMRMLMPSHAKNVQPYKDKIPIFQRYQVESQLDAMFSPVVELPSGGYLVINPTEALVSIDVNSGRATREHNIEDTALQTNLEAAQEVARQLKLRDLAGLVVIDFIDMEDNRNNRAVERRLKDCLKTDRARIQVGRISGFGLLEMSRQRLRAGVLEGSTVTCPHCDGKGIVRSIESAALRALRIMEEECMRKAGVSLTLRVPTNVANYIHNQKRGDLLQIEERYGATCFVEADPSLSADDHEIEKSGHRAPPRRESTDSQNQALMDEVEQSARSRGGDEDADEERGGRKRKRKRKRKSRREDGQEIAAAGDGQDGQESESESQTAEHVAKGEGDDDSENRPRRRRRGKRGGRRGRGRGERNNDANSAEESRAQELSDDPATVDSDTPDEISISSPDAEPSETQSEEPDTNEGSMPTAGSWHDGSESQVEAPSAAAPEESAFTSPEAEQNAHMAVNGDGQTNAEARPSDVAGEVSETEVVEEERDAPQPAPPTPDKPKRRGWWQRRLG